MTPYKIGGQEGHLETLYNLGTKVNVWVAAQPDGAPDIVKLEGVERLLKGLKREQQQARKE